MTTKIIFDTDPGIDDAMALLFIEASPALDLLAITTIYGNADIETTTRNALYLKQRFGLAASRLSVEIDRRGGPTDLRCIFRGMAEETDKQLAAAGGATTGADQAKAYARLTDMLKDAVEIAPAVGGMPPVKAGAARASATQCPALRQL